MTTPSDKYSADALQHLWCEAIVATQDGASGRMVCDVESLLRYVNTRKGSTALPECGARQYHPMTQEKIDKMLGSAVPKMDEVQMAIGNLSAGEFRAVQAALNWFITTRSTTGSSDAERYRFLRTNYSRHIIEICCGTFNGQTVEQAEVRLDAAIARSARGRGE